MGTELVALDWVCAGVRLIAIASFPYFLYLVTRFWNVLDTTSPEMPHYLVWKAWNHGGSAQPPR